MTDHSSGAVWLYSHLQITQVDGTDTKQTAHKKVLRQDEAIVYM